MHERKASMNKATSHNPHEAKLVRDERGLTLVGGPMELRCDFEKLLARTKPAALPKELLVKAAKTKSDNPVAIDCTAGLGHDSFLLAAAGFSVIMFERDESIAALLEDGIDRAQSDEALAPIVKRMKLVRGDSLDFLSTLANSGEIPPDVVYLDPMFPERQKSASVKKKFQLLHVLEKPCEEAEEIELVRAAYAAGPRKIIVKRPAKGPHLAGIKPSYAISGKAVRYDVIVSASTKLF